MQAAGAKARRVLGSIALAAIATIATLGIAEVAVRLLAAEEMTPQPSTGVAPQDRGLPELRTVSELARPNQRGTFQGVLHRTNSRGVRGPEYESVAPPGTFRIVVVGDSYTMGQGVEEADAYPAVTERRLNERGDSRRYEVINLGVAGLAIRHSVRRLKRVGMGYRPQLVVYGFTPNDVMGPAFEEATEEENARARALIHRFDDSPSKLLGLVWRRLVLARSALWPIPGTYEHVLEENYFRNPEAARQIDDGLEELARLAQTHGVCAHVFVHTRMNQLWIHPFRRIYRHVADSARERGLGAQVSLSFFRGRDVDALRISPVDTHPNAEGHRLHAEALIAGLDALPERCWSPEHFTP